MIARQQARRGLAAMLAVAVVGLFHAQPWRTRCTRTVRYDRIEHAGYYARWLLSPSAPRSAQWFRFAWRPVSGGAWSTYGVVLSAPHFGVTALRVWQPPRARALGDGVQIETWVGPDPVEFAVDSSGPFTLDDVTPAATSHDHALRFDH